MPVLQTKRERVVRSLRLVVDHVDDLPIVDVSLRESSSYHPLPHRVLEVPVARSVDDSVQKIVRLDVWVGRPQPAFAQYVAVATSTQTLERVRDAVDGEERRLLGRRLQRR